MLRYLKIVLLIFIISIFIPGELTAAAEVNSRQDNHCGLQIADTVSLLVDDREAAPENRPFLLSCGRTVITLQALQNLFPCQSERGPEGELVILWEQTRIQLFPGQNRMLVNTDPQELVLAPIAMPDGNFLLPLRNLAEVMGYQIFFDSPSQTVRLYSPGFEPLPPASAPQPVQFDYSTLPVWGALASVPALTALWPEEDIVAGYFTKLVNSPAGRTNNILLSAAKISGNILQADDIFSFNETVGPRTAQNGYQNAKIFVGQKVVTGIGGGICQTSSTLYNAALETGLQVLERWPHSLPVFYAPANRDATVSWGGADFRFRNTSGSPLKILCKVEDGYVFAAFARVWIPSGPDPAPGPAGLVIQTRFFQVSEPLAYGNMTSVEIGAGACQQTYSYPLNLNFSI